MKIIVSTDSVRYPLTGIGRYTTELIEALKACDDIRDLRYFAGSRFQPGLPSPSQPTTSSQNAQQNARLRQFVLNSRPLAATYRHLLPLAQRRALRHCGDYLYHGTNFYLPPAPGLKIATFHDLSVYSWPHCHPPGRVRHLKKMLDYTLRHADALITDSEFVRRELAEYFDWPLARIHTVPLASSPEFHPRDTLELQPALSRHGLTPGGYSLFVGTIEPRKNLLALLEAYGSLPSSLRQRWPLVLAGHPGWQSDDIHQRIRAAAAAGWVRYLGYTDAADLPLLYAGARLFAFPSLYEGFGLPLLEAMASGVPVVCSDRASLPEVVGEVALMAAAEDTEGLATQLQRGLEDEPWREWAIAAGIERAATFSWARCAGETVAVYRQVIAAA